MFRRNGAFGLSCLLSCLLVLSAVGCANDDELACARAQLLLRQGSITGALNTLRAAARDPGGTGETAATHLVLAEALTRAQRFTEAEAAARHALARATDPATRGTARRTLASLLARSGHTAEAEALLFAGSQGDPRDADTHVALGVLRLERGDFVTARREFERAFDHPGQHVAAAYNLGRLAVRMGELDEAERRFSDLEGRAPDRPYGAYGRAVVAARRKQPEAACAALARARDRGLGNGQRVRRDRELSPLPACVASLWGPS